MARIAALPRTSSSRYPSSQSLRLVVWVSGTATCAAAFVAAIDPGASLWAAMTEADRDLIEENLPGCPIEAYDRSDVQGFVGMREMHAWGWSPKVTGCTETAE